MSDLAPFSVSARAANRIAEIIGQKGGEAALRVEVLAGGCNGFQYRFDLDQRVADDDVIVPAGPADAGIRVVIDPTSLDLLRGAELDYKEALMGSHFTVRNPNAVSSCGCGTSFAVE